MRYSVLLLTALFVLSGCSMFQRSREATRETEPAMLPPGVALHNPEDDSEDVANSSANMEGEVAKLNTKIEALETKLAVLTHAFENFQAKKSQPLISADQPNEPPAALSEGGNQAPSLAVPVVEQPKEPNVKNVAAAPSPPMRGSSAVESEFRKAMSEFQQGHYRESAQQFSALSQENPNHLLSAHALYWAGESNARIQQWSSAVENWESIEKNYPTSTYVPEALAGLAKAYEVQGNVAKAKAYKETLTRSFPNSPVALAIAASGVSQKDSTSESPAAGTQEEHNEDGE